MRIIAGVACVLLNALVACGGLAVPQMADIYQSKPDEIDFENTLINDVRCELTLGVRRTLNELKQAPLVQDVSWLAQWGAKVTLKLTVDEKSSLNPGVSLNEPLANDIKVFSQGGNVTTPRSRSLGVGLTGSADATRTETISFTYAFADLLKKDARNPIQSCREYQKGLMIESDLKIGEFIYTKAQVASVPGTIVSPFSDFSYDVTFIASFGGNATPTWKFARSTVDPTSPFFSASRQKTHDLTISIGPAKPAVVVKDSKGKIVYTAHAAVSPETEQQHFATQIGQAVATAIQSQARP